MSKCKDDNRVLIIGYGNPLRADDGFGFLAAERLRELLHGPAVEIISAHQLLPEMAEPISRAGLVVFIDACCDRPPGHVLFQKIETGTGSVSKSAPPPFISPHQFDPAALVDLGRRLYDAEPEAHIVAVGGLDFGCHEQLSDVVQAIFGDVVTRVRELIEHWLAEHGERAYA